MEAVGLAFAVAQSVLAVLECSDLKELFSRFKYKTELEELKKTVLTIQSVLVDADAKGVLNHQEQGFVDNLKNALYDADDLLDEFATVAAQEKQRLLTEGEGLRRVSKKVRRLFSRFEKLSVAYGMSREVKKIRVTLDGIASDASKFCFKVDNQPLRQRKETTCSYVYQPDIIGREEDTKRVLDMLLDPNVEGHIPVLTIVGMGGLGKTALAQLVFNDSRIETHFPLKLWACVNDEGQSQLNVDSVLGSILKSASPDETHIDGLVREQLQRKIREKLDGKNYLLVLDDVWTEKHTEWLKLVEFLKGGQGGSRIVVTTRSKGTATVVGSDNSKLTYVLEGLSDDNSWRLFEGTIGQVQANRPDLVAIGRSIVKKCANVPLAIKVIGSLLYGQDESKWQSFEANKLSEIRKGKNDIIQILKFSYNHLSPLLKSCFTYCALFPKDYVIDRDMLISLWMAQGYIQPLDIWQSIEDAAAEYFLILLRRCFFQDVKKDKFGKIVSCKIHDLMHDVAQEVARNEICVIAANTTMSSLGETIRHISHDPNTCTKIIFTKTKIRTYLSHQDQKVQFVVGALLANLNCLRVLDLNSCGIKSLPDTIGGMLHLRYIDLSLNVHLEVLPNSITKLHNLQTLLLVCCSRLRVLPKDLSKLVNLRVVDVSNCKSLTYMPPSMGKLTFLCKLPVYIAVGRNSRSERGVGEIEDLGPLKNLKGNLTIRIRNDYRYCKDKCGEGAGYLSNKEHLDDISIEWPSDVDGYEGRVQEQEALLEDLQPHCNLRVLSLNNYSGERIPKWAGDNKLATSLRSLVKIKFVSCQGLQELPWLSKLPNLKSIKFEKLNNLEYIQDDNTSCSSSTSYGAAATEIELPLFFPSLEKLKLLNMPELKGWWRGSGDNQLVGNDSMSSSSQSVSVLPWFAGLSKLEILSCPNLTSIPPCPMLQSLSLGYIASERLRIITMKEIEDDKLAGDMVSGGSMSPSSSSAAMSVLWDSGYQRHDDDHHHAKLRSMKVYDVGSFKSLTVGAFCFLTKLVISFDREIENLSQAEEVLCSCSSSLRSLEISYCFDLRSISIRGGLEHLTALEELTLIGLSELMFVEDEDDDMPWRSLGGTLRSLQLFELSKLVKLPRGMRHLTSLQSLRIRNCPLEEGLPEWIGSCGCFSSLQSLYIRGSKINSLPETMRNLTSLTTLQICACTPALIDRCQARNPEGEDWPKIQHIPRVKISLDW